MLEPAVLRDRARYERRIDGWVDNTHDDALTHTVRIVEPGRELQLTAVVTPPPAYLIRAVRCRTRDDDLEAATGLDTLIGTAMTAGLTRRAAAAVGAGRGAALVVDAIIEAARLARQVTKLPPARAARAERGDSREYWRLDTESWNDLPDSCFTYSDVGRRLFDTRPVVAAATPALYSPPPGQRKVFERRKLMRVERRDDRLVLFHSMHDNVHGFEVTYEIDAASARIVTAEHITPRLPYMGVCSEPQRRIAALVGETADAGLRRRIGEHLGGPAGCAQLYDLTADLLKLLA